MLKRLGIPVILLTLMLLLLPASASARVHWGVYVGPSYTYPSYYYPSPYVYSYSYPSYYYSYPHSYTYSYTYRPYRHRHHAYWYGGYWRERAPPAVVGPGGIVGAGACAPRPPFFCP